MHKHFIVHVRPKEMNSNLSPPVGAYMMTTFCESLFAYTVAFAFSTCCSAVRVGSCLSPPMQDS